MNFFKDKPALALFFIAPILGELFSGSLPLNEFINPLAFMTSAMLYGSGAIIARELKVRWGKGWLSLLLLGFAYGIFEEGIMVRSFFDPNWMDLGSLGTYGRIDGLNVVWAYHLTVYHAIVSILASITLAEILYPAHRRESWVHSKKWRRIIWGLLLLTLPLGKILTPYDAPDNWILLSWIGILLLMGIARFAPDLRLPPSKKPVPRPRRFFLLAFFGTFMHHIFIYTGADNHTYAYNTAIQLTFFANLLILWLALRWSKNFTAWQDTHRYSFLTGILAFFLALSPFTIGSIYPILYITSPIFLFILRRIYKSIQAREEIDLLVDGTRIP
jgi:hypothetical protein